MCDWLKTFVFKIKYLLTIIAFLHIFPFDFKQVFWKHVSFRNLESIRKKDALLVVYTQYAKSTINLLGLYSCQQTH